ncbi:MAG: hypothetical protein RLZZ491_801 [Pseudomonadota bacterium]|jgi:hypothetical protein
MVGQLAKLAGLCGGLALLAGCGGNGLFSGPPDEETRAAQQQELIDQGLLVDPNRETIFDLFANADDPNNTVAVNRYLWMAALEVLDFMPVEAADPFSGIIQFGFAAPPGGGTAYRATVYVQDPALEARSLRVSVESRAGAVSRDVARQIEDAILTRARQLRIRDADL